jgi:hypothetical protein
MQLAYKYIYIYGSYLTENTSFTNDYLMLMREIFSVYCDNYTERM